MASICHRKHYPQVIASRMLFPAVKLRNVLLTWRPKGLHSDKTRMTDLWKSCIHTPGAWQPDCNISHTAILLLLAHQRKETVTYTSNTFQRKTEAAKLIEIFKGWNQQLLRTAPLSPKLVCCCPSERTPEMWWSLDSQVCFGVSFHKWSWADHWVHGTLVLAST